ncbi:unnamed protein product, partial [Cyprideis torosa]
MQMAWKLHRYWSFGLLLLYQLLAVLLYFEYWSTSEENSSSGRTFQFHTYPSGELLPQGGEDVCRVIPPPDYTELDKLMHQSSPKVCPGAMPRFEVKGNQLRLREKEKGRNENLCSFTELVYVNRQKI